MIKTLTIDRFKSIKGLQLDCRRINLFIGEPNVGKSNILEALGLLSWCASAGKPLKEFVRFQMTQHLFYDGIMDDPIQIGFQGDVSGELKISFSKDQFRVSSNHPLASQVAILDYKGVQPVSMRVKDWDAFRFYRFRMMEKYDSGEPGALIPPDGRNLFSVVYGSKPMREWLVELYRAYGLAVVMKPHEKAFELQKQQDGVVTAYPYTMSSDTLQRMLFYHAAMASNKDSVIIFEEPEAHAFPYYTKQLGESLALGDTNQYFIATHNPYLLGAIVEKAPKSDVAVFATYYRDFETRTKLLSDAELGRILDGDPFLSLELVLEEGAAG